MARALPCLLFLSLLSACATWSEHGIAPRPPQKLRVAVLPVEIAVRVKRLNRIETLPDSKAALADEARLIDARMRRTADHITQELETRLAESYFFEVAADSDVRTALMAQGIASSTAPLTAAQARELGRALGADALLMTRLSGYGSIKKRWLFYLIGTGVLEGVVQGVVTAAAIGNPWLAASIGAEEVASEGLEWGGGAYLFSRFFSPVILEGRLVNAKDGETFWSATALESRNRKAVKALPKDEQKKREVRLRLTAEKAAASLVKKLDKKAWANLKDEDKRAAPQPR